MNYDLATSQALCYSVRRPNRGYDFAWTGDFCGEQG
jgi:hypothetical protein